MTDGPAMLNALRDVQRLNQQVAQLLKTAEQYLVAESNLRSVKGTRAAGRGSTSLNDPIAWTPGYAARFLLTPDPHIITFVSVVLVDRPNDSFARPFTEPLVSAGWLRFESAVDPNWRHWGWAKMAHWTDHPPDGTMSDRVIPKPQQDESGCSRQRCASLPLVSVRSAPQLIEGLLEPLLASLPPGAS